MSVLEPLSHVLATVVATAHEALTSLGADPGGGATWVLSVAAVVLVVRLALLPLVAHGVRHGALLGPGASTSCRRCTSALPRPHRCREPAAAARGAQRHRRRAPHVPARLPAAAPPAARRGWRSTTCCPRWRRACRSGPMTPGTGCLAGRGHPARRTARRPRLPRPRSRPPGRGGRARDAGGRTQLRHPAIRRRAQHPDRRAARCHGHRPAPAAGRVRALPAGRGRRRPGRPAGVPGVQLHVDARPVGGGHAVVPDAGDAGGGPGVGRTPRSAGRPTEGRRRGPSASARSGARPPRWAGYQGACAARRRHVVGVAPGALASTRPVSAWPSRVVAAIEVLAGRHGQRLAEGDVRGAGAAAGSDAASARRPGRPTDQSRWVPHSATGTQRRARLAGERGGAAHQRADGVRPGDPRLREHAHGLALAEQAEGGAGTPRREPRGRPGRAASRPSPGGAGAVPDVVAGQEPRASGRARGRPARSSRKSGYDTWLLASTTGPRTRQVLEAGVAQPDVEGADDRARGDTGRAVPALHVGGSDPLRRTAAGRRGRSSDGPPSARPGRRGRGPRR